VPGLEQYILVVDDESAVCNFVALVLRSRGFEVRTANSASEALELFFREGELIRLLLTDVLMPDVTGSALVSQVLVSRPDLPVLYMSGYRDEDADPLAGSFPCLKKPFSPAELLARIEQSLASPAIVSGAEPTSA
jgi:DNA-binding NtrC family response regulator